MKPDAIIAEIAKWLPVAWRLRSLFGGDKRAALAALRKLELQRRVERDKRMGR